MIFLLQKLLRLSPLPQKNPQTNQTKNFKTQQRELTNQTKISYEGTNYEVAWKKKNHIYKV